MRVNSKIQFPIPNSQFLSSQSQVLSLVHCGESPYTPSVSFPRRRESRVSKRTLDSGSSPGMTTLRIARRRKTCTNFYLTILVSSRRDRWYGWSAHGGPRTVVRRRSPAYGASAYRKQRPVRRGKILKIPRFKFQAPSPTFQAPETEGQGGIWKIMDVQVRPSTKITRKEKLWMLPKIRGAMVGVRIHFRSPRLIQ